MRISVLVNNYNYGEFVCEAVRSALKQTLLPDQIVVVDDGSTDASVELLNAEFSSDSRVEIVAKENGGQLSAFNAGYARATGDLFFFLDADDLYREDYLETAVACYAARPECDFLFCDVEEFGEVGERFTPPHPGNRDLGFSAIDTLYTRAYIGGPTSSISMRKTMADRFMPVELEADWRTQADTCLTWGASLSGAHKFSIEAPLVRYRAHGSNHFYGTIHSPTELYEVTLRSESTIEHLARKRALDRKRLSDRIVREFKTTQERGDETFRRYLGIIRDCDRSWRWRADRELRLRKAYRQMRRARTASRPGRR